MTVLWILQFKKGWISLKWLFKFHYILKMVYKTYLLKRNNLFLEMTWKKRKSKKPNFVTGDLPEITNHVIHHLQNNLKSLHSCILVYRFLCQIVIPILWERPFSTVCQEGYHYNFLILTFYLLMRMINEITKIRNYNQFTLA
jgi:hypothetical protein